MQDTQTDAMKAKSLSVSETAAMLRDAAKRCTNSGKTTIGYNLNRLAEQIEKSGALPVAVAAVQAAPHSEQVDIPKALPSGEVSNYGNTPYVSQDGEVELALAIIRAGEHPLFGGGAGCGKTHLAHHLAARLGRKIFTIQGAEGAVPEYIIGYRDMENGNTKYTYGVAAQAAKEGGILYWDEPNATPDGIRMWLFSLMDGRREITLPENGGEVIKAHPNFTVIGAMNEGKGNFAGTTELSEPQRERFACMTLGYLPAAKERKLLVSRTGCAEEIAEKLVALGKQLRASFERGDIHTSFGTRSLLKAAKLIVQGVKPLDATKVAMVNAISANNDSERKAVATATAAYFGKNAATEAKAEVK